MEGSRFSVFAKCLCVVELLLCNYCFIAVCDIVLHPLTVISFFYSWKAVCRISFLQQRIASVPFILQNIIDSFAGPRPVQRLLRIQLLADFP